MFNAIIFLNKLVEVPKFNLLLRSHKGCNSSKLLSEYIFAQEALGHLGNFHTSEIMQPALANILN